MVCHESLDGGSLGVVSDQPQCNEARNQGATAGFGAKAELIYANREGWTLGLFDVYTGPIPGFTLSANPHVAEAPVGGERSAGIREISRPGSEARGVFRPWQQSGRSSGVSTGVGLHLGGDSAV